MTPKAGKVSKVLKDMDLPNEMFSPHLDKIRTECVSCGKKMETSLNVLIKIMCQTCINERYTRQP